MKMMKSQLILIFAILTNSFSLTSYGQERQFSLIDAEAEFNKPLGVVLNNVKTMGYVLNEYTPDIRSYHYTKVSPLVGNIGAYILVGFSKSKTLVFLGWVEYRGYQDIITTELAESGFEKDEHLENAYIKVYNNFKKGLRILMSVTPSSPYTISVNLEVIPRSKKQAEGVKTEKEIQHYLPEPRTILYCNYRKLVDSLKKNEIEYKRDTALAEDEFIGYYITTNTGQYFVHINYLIGSYQFQVPVTFNDVFRYYQTKGAKVIKREESYSTLSYGIYNIEINEMIGGKCNVVFEVK
jgi:hypothetical protein